MKNLPGLSYREIMWKINYPTLLRIIADMPQQRYLSDDEVEKNKAKELTPQNAKDFKSYIETLKEKNKKK